MAEETQEQSTQAPEGQAEGGQAAETPDLSEQFQALSQRVEAIEGGGKQEEPAEQDGDFYSLLAGELRSGQQQGEEHEDGYGQNQEFSQGEAGNESDDELAQFDSYLAERINEAMYPHLQQIETDRRRGQLAELAERYPGIREEGMLDRVRSRLQPLAEYYGTEDVISNPMLVEQAYLAERAMALSEQEQAADGQRDQGAHLETGASASAAESLDPAEEIKRGILEAGGGNDPFTSGRAFGGP